MKTLMITVDGKLTIEPWYEFKTKESAKEFVLKMGWIELENKTIMPSKVNDTFYYHPIRVEVCILREVSEL